MSFLLLGFLKIRNNCRYLPRHRVNLFFPIYDLSGESLREKTSLLSLTVWNQQLWPTSHQVNNDSEELCLRTKSVCMWYIQDWGQRCIPNLTWNKLSPGSPVCESNEASHFCCSWCDFSTIFSPLTQHTYNQKLYVSVEIRYRHLFPKCYSIICFIKLRSHRVICPNFYIW